MIENWNYGLTTGVCDQTSDEAKFLVENVMEKHIFK